VNSGTQCSNRLVLNDWTEHNGGERMSAMEKREYSIAICEEDWMLWATVDELPGVFASGENHDELLEALGEAILMVDPPEQTHERTFRPSPPMPQPHLRRGSLVMS